MMTSLEEASVEVSEVCLALGACQVACSVEVDLAILGILGAEDSLSNSLVFHLWAAQALLQPKLKPLSRMASV